MAALGGLSGFTPTDDIKLKSVLIWKANEMV